MSLGDKDYENIFQVLTGIKVDCACCGKRINVNYCFKCLYCCQWFCYDCAKKHFGPNKEKIKSDPSIGKLEEELDILQRKTEEEHHNLWARIKKLEEGIDQYFKDRGSPDFIVRINEKPGKLPGLSR